MKEKEKRGEKEKKKKEGRSDDRQSDFDRFSNYQPALSTLPFLIINGFKRLRNLPRIPLLPSLQRRPPRVFCPPCEKIPPSNDPITDVRSKDVTVSSETPIVSTRIFIPKITNPNQKFPLLFYVHGGGFFMLSVFAKQYQDFCTTVSAQANVVVMSVEPKPWLNNHVDFGRVFIGGDSAGGNISHTLAFWFGSIGLSGLNLDGLILMHPYFSRTEDDQMWLYMCPMNIDRLEDPWLKPPARDLARLGCERVLVFVAEKDHLNVVGKNYYEELKRNGWQGSVEIV
ncbi:hypothetical protein QYF36_013567 [Acer negundo]|nr:hypothetical protein QYF36_013567 [Acer negundo]